MAVVKNVTQKRAEKVLAAVAVWMGPHMKADGSPADTGPEAANTGSGPMLVMDYEGWTGPARPTIILEGGPEDWAIRVGEDETFRKTVQDMGLWTEAQASYALSIFVDTF